MIQVLWVCGILKCTTNRFLTSCYLGTLNDILLVNVNTTLQPVLATCTFLSGFTGDALCRVDFTGPDGVTYTSVSTERGSAGESVTVELTLNGTALLPNTTYSYQATLKNSTESLCVRVIGQFTTGEYNIKTSVFLIAYLYIVLLSISYHRLHSSRPWSIC